jgi:hypothetical protein
MYTDLSNICADLSHRRQEEQSCHPFLVAEPGLTSEVVKMLDNSLEDILQSWVRALRVDELDIVCDVVNSKVLERRYVHFRRIHRDEIMSRAEE